MAQPRSDALAELEPLMADHDGRTPAELGSPFGRLVVRPPQRPWDQRRGEGVVFLGAHVDQSGRFGHTNETVKLVDGNRVESRHDASLCLRVDAMLRRVASWGDRIPHE